MQKATCYAWGRPGDWEAICVAYDLAAQGESREEVCRELGDAIETYLAYTADLPEDERPRFLNRKSPLSLRLRLALAHRVFSLLNWLKLRTADRGFDCASYSFQMFPTWQTKSTS